MADLKRVYAAPIEETALAELDSHLGMTGTNVPTSPIIATGQSPSESAANTVSLKWTGRRTGRVPSSRRYCQSARGACFRVRRHYEKPCIWQHLRS
jgi:hypothetical protein